MKVDWVQVAKSLGVRQSHTFYKPKNSMFTFSQTNRTPIDCMRHGTSRPRHVWTDEADKKLIAAIESCGIDNWQQGMRYVHRLICNCSHGLFSGEKGF